MTDTLHDTDFVTWTARQAAALRDAASRGSNLPIDWENLAEEIEDVGNEVRNKVESLTVQIHIHLLKMACLSFDRTRAHWIAEIDEFRDQLERQLRQNHALRAKFPDIAQEQFVRAVKRMERLFRENEEPTTSLTRLSEWRTRGITAEEVREDGAYPAADDIEFRRSLG